MPKFRRLSPSSGPVATTVGSLPGTDALEAARVVAGETPDFPVLPELPARGPGADMIGRTLGLLAEVSSDFRAQTTPSGWALAGSHGLRAGQSWLHEDLDRLEEVLEGFTGPVKFAIAGPWTMAAAVAGRNGEPLLFDRGATSELAVALAEAARSLSADVARRLPGAQQWLQLDEPGLPAVLRGSVESTSGYRAATPVLPVEAQHPLRGVVEAVSGRAQVVVHCCASHYPADVVTGAGAHGISLDLTLADPATEESLAAALEADTALFLGAVSTAALSGQDATMRHVDGFMRRMGLDWSEAGAAIAITPTCGLAHSPDFRAAIAQTVSIARRLGGGE